jgi:hypothetical protein
MCSLLRHRKFRSLHKFQCPTFNVRKDPLDMFKHYKLLTDFMFSKIQYPLRNKLTNGWISFNALISYTTIRIVFIDFLSICSALHSALSQIWTWEVLWFLSRMQNCKQSVPIWIFRMRMPLWNNHKKMCVFIVTHRKVGKTDWIMPSRKWNGVASPVRPSCVKQPSCVTRSRGKNTYHLAEFCVQWTYTLRRSTPGHFSTR